MDKLFILNNQVNALDIQDAISARITKAQGVAAAVTSDLEGENFSLAPRIISDLIWAIEGYLEEIKELQRRLWDMYKETEAAKVS